MTPLLEGATPILFRRYQKFFQHGLYCYADRIQPPNEAARPDSAGRVPNNATNAGWLNPAFVERNLTRKRQKLDSRPLYSPGLGVSPDESRINQAAKATPYQGSPKSELTGCLFESFQQVLVRSQANARYPTCVDL